MDIQVYDEKDRSAFTRLREEAFADDEAYIDAMASAFGDDLEVFSLKEDGELKASLTKFRMGEMVFDGTAVPAEISYAICTAAKERGRGYGSAVTKYARDLAVSGGAVSILTPANEGLIAFYEALGYSPLFYIEEREALARDMSAAAFKAEKLTAEGYGNAREELLADRVHIRLSGETLSFVRSLSLDGDGLYSVELGGRRAVCALQDDEDDEHRLFIQELITSPGDSGDPADLAAALTFTLGRSACTFRTPAAAASDTKKLQAMIVSPQELPSDSFGEASPYFGFPFE